MASDDGTNDGKKLKRKKYEKELLKLQAELCRLQAWVKHKGLRAIIVFEGVRNSLRRTEHLAECRGFPFCADV